MTTEAFLRWEGSGDTRYELVRGRVVAMAPPTPVHGKLVARFVAAILRRLRPPCDLVVEAGIRLEERSGSFYQADLAVSCTGFGQSDRYLPDPLLIVEILSPSTQTHDRGNKVADYRTLPSVREIVLVSSTAVHVELWRRTDEGWRVMDLIGRDTRLGLESVDAEVTLAELYAGIGMEGDGSE
ncbi:MAG: Uma2 family endonuclease [Magnetococcales bacterium]|nr:Uma2 family endonuclease [Magnetococcales bacterium]